MELNYFSYFSEIEEHFVRRRGKNLMVAPLDWCLIQLWKEQGVPLHVVLRGIDRTFESAESRRRTPRSLSYCHPAVLEAFEEYREAMTGSGGPVPEGSPEGPSEAADPDVRERALAWLTACAGRLGSRSEDAAVRAGRRISDLAAEVAARSELNPGRLDLELSEIALAMAEELWSLLDPTLRKELEEECKEDLAIYRKRVSREIYRRLERKQRERKIRERFDLPDLSLLQAELGG